MSSDDQFIRNFGKHLAQGNLETAYDKYLVIGFQQETHGDYVTNCSREELALMLQLFSEIYDNK